MSSLTFMLRTWNEGNVLGACSKGYLLPDVRDKKWIIRVLREKILILRE